MAREACAHHEHEDKAPFRRVAPCSSPPPPPPPPPSRLLLHRLHVVSSICLPSFFLLVSFSPSSVYFFTVRELSTSTFMCTHACSFVSLKLDVFPTPMTVKSGLFFLPRERSSFRGSRSNGLHASIKSRESSSTLKLYYTSSEQIIRFDSGIDSLRMFLFRFVLLYFD